MALVLLRGDPRGGREAVGQRLEEAAEDGTAPGAGRGGKQPLWEPPGHAAPPSPGSALGSEPGEDTVSAAPACRALLPLQPWDPTPGQRCPRSGRETAGSRRCPPAGEAPDGAGREAGPIIRGMSVPPGGAGTSEDLRPQRGRGFGCPGLGGPGKGRVVPLGPQDF